MRILHITNMYHPSVSGVGQVTREFVRSLSGIPGGCGASRGFYGSSESGGSQGKAFQCLPDSAEQKVICFGSGRGTVWDFVDGVEVIRCGVEFTIRSQQISFSYPRILKKTIQEFRPDVVFVNYPNPYLIHHVLRELKRLDARGTSGKAARPSECGAADSEAGRIRLFTYWHSDIIRQKLLSRLFDGEIKRLIERSEKVLYSSKTYFNGSDYSSLVGSKMAVVPIPIDNTVAELSEEEKAEVAGLKKAYAGRLLCVNLARHVPYKGLKYLIEAAGELDDRFRFVLLGRGPLSEDLKRQAEAVNSASCAIPGGATQEENGITSERERASRAASRTEYEQGNSLPTMAEALNHASCGAGKTDKSADGSADEKIRFITEVSESTKKIWLSAADVFCFPSVTKNEAFGIALGEAMACGKPSVTFHIPGSGENELCRSGKECIECKNPLDGSMPARFAENPENSTKSESNAGHAQSLGAALRLLSDDPSLRERLGSSARDRVRTVYSPSRFAETVKSLLFGVREN